MRQDIRCDNGICKEFGSIIEDAKTTYRDDIIGMINKDLLNQAI